ncbi:MAG: glycosyltransferase family 39 protein [Chloroflexi bacterium]|nr:glycosyltransferase family 39 protein [Chloroflexota bacterium]
MLVVALAAAALWNFGTFPSKQAGDEANWVGTARFFLVLFVRHDVSIESWPDSYWTRTQPMIPRYIMGGWLWARGLPFEHLDPNYDHRRKWFSNVEAGKAPDQGTLTEVRLPMRGLAALSALLVYGVVRALAGPVGGATAALLFMGSPYLKLHLVRAMGEPPFIVFLLATLLAAVLMLRRPDRARALGWRSALAVGSLLGLAFASKLTAIVAIVGVVAWGAWATFGPLVRARLLATGSDPHPDAAAPAASGSLQPVWWRPLAWALATIALVYAVFVLTNPFLYRDPVGRTLLLFQNRQQEMAQQAEIDPSRAVPELGQRVQRVIKFSLFEDTWGDSTLRRPLEALLAVVGLLWLVWKGVRWRPGAESLLLLWALGFFAAVSLGLGYVLDHYFVPTATLGLVVGGVGVGWTADAAWRRTMSAVRRRQAPDVPHRAHLPLSS